MFKITAAVAIAFAFSGFGAATAAVAEENDNVVIVEETPEMVQELIYDTPVLNCEAWQVPGWLNEFGDPTGCVDNAPCPEAREGLPCSADIPVVITEEPVEVTPPLETVLVPEVISTPEVITVDETGEQVPMLAETGFENWGFVIFAIASILLGLSFTRLNRN